MSKCTIDHSVEDVKSKLEDQESFLPKVLYEKVRLFLTKELDQSTLNEVFHLLKKYDLATVEVREERDEALRQLI